MPEMVDGAFGTPDGRRKSAVRRRDGESADDFAERAMRLLQKAETGHVLEVVIGSSPEDWTARPGNRWFEATHRTMSGLHLRLTAHPSTHGRSSGHLTIEWDGLTRADAWGVHHEGVFLPRPDGGYISTGWAKIWGLVHAIKGLDSQYEQIFARTFAPTFGPDDLGSPDDGERPW